MEHRGGAPGESAHDGPPPVQLRLLGPFEVVVAGRRLHIGSPKQRAVLALLGLQAGKVVTANTLCDLVWDDQQPASPSATLQSLISRLRAALATAPSDVVAGGRDVLRTREPGWVLDVDRAAVDALRFEELMVRGRRQRESGDVASSVADFTEAVSLWRGAALLDVVDAGYLASQATGLNQARLDAVEDLAEAELASGRPAEALARLETHVEDSPLRERAWGLLMVALYRMGRQAAALRAFQQVRGLLNEQLGLEPSPELAGIERQILSQDPALAGPHVTAPATAPPAPAGPPQSPAGDLADYSVVVVEDHDFQRRTVVQLLRSLGVGTVRDAADGMGAFHLIETGPTPDIVICDIDMPGMDGVEFVARIAERKLACALVIASGLEANVLRAVEAIGESHGIQVLAALEKPLTARRLGEVLRGYTRLRNEPDTRADTVAVGGEALRAAVESGAFTTQFEPRIDLASGAVSSAEAGSRWYGAEGDLVPGSTLASMLEREHLTIPFVEQLVAASCTMVDEATAAGLDADASLRVAVNVSLLPLGEPSIADRLTAMVLSHGQHPRRFVWEVDDVALARASVAMVQVLTRLRVKGFGLSMSNCGLGTAWTNHVERVPLSELKLDRRLVDGVSGDAKRLAALESALASAREFGLAVVADGCDSRDDFDALLALGCSEAQGRFVAEPMPGVDLVAWAMAGYAPDDVVSTK